MAYIMNDSAYLRLDGANAMVGSIPMGGSKITDLGDGTDAGDAVTKGQLDNALPLGFIGMYSGDGTNLGTEWAICDGNNGTPNLVNQFVRGTDIAGIGTTGGSDTAVVASHSHTGSASSISTFTGDALTEHSHSATNGNYVLNQGNTADYGAGGFPSGQSTSSATAGASAGTPTGTVSTTTTITVDGAGVDPTNANIPAYYALAYIMKIA